LTDSINPQINYWIARSEETLKEAKILAEAGYWNACVNRLYYSCFYAITALLVRDGLSTSKHSGVRGFFNRNYVKTGIVPKDLAKVYNLLFDLRQEADYVEFVCFDENQVFPWIPRTEEFIQHLISVLNSDRDNN
jgi:uncharacterized protein (UPF0332 family)